MELYYLHYSCTLYVFFFFWINRSPWWPAHSPHFPTESNSPKALDFPLTTRPILWRLTHSIHCSPAFFDTLYSYILLSSPAPPRLSPHNVLNLNKELTCRFKTKWTLYHCPCLLYLKCMCNLTFPGTVTHEWSVRLGGPWLASNRRAQTAKRCNVSTCHTCLLLDQIHVMAFVAIFVKFIIFIKLMYVIVLCGVLKRKSGDLCFRLTNVFAESCFKAVEYFYPCTRTIQAEFSR